MNNYRTRRIVLMESIFILGIIVAFVSAQTWSGKTIKDGDITIIKNPKEPMFKGDILALKEDLRVGGSKAKGDYIFSGILTLAVDNEENIYILDEKESLIKVFDKSGNYLRTIGRKGQGPGEINFPYALDLNSATREIVVLDAPSRRFSFFNFQGRFLRSQSLQSVSGRKMRFDSRGHIILLSFVLGGDNPHSELKIYRPDMTPLLALAESPASMSANRVVNPFRPTPVFAVDRNDNVIFAVPSDYDLKIVNSDHKVFRRIQKEFDPVEITEIEKNAITKDAPPAAKYEFDKYHAPFKRFLLDDEGRLLVQTFEKAINTTTYLYDVFDTEGRFIGRIPLAGTPIVMKKDKLYSLEDDEDGFQIVKRYAVKWLIK